MRIVGKVARVIPPHQFAVNVGSEAGVVKGAKAGLYKSYDINDPESGAELGVLTYTTVGGEVIMVAERFCVVQITDRTPPSTIAAFALLQSSNLYEVTADAALARGNVKLVAVGSEVKIEVPEPDGTAEPAGAMADEGDALAEQSE
jgi:hypothetical protein